MTDADARTRRAALVVDVANVVGSRPDGWWRDRAGATTRLLTALAAAVRHAPSGEDVDAGAVAAVRERRVVVVLEGEASAAARDGWDGLDVVLAERDGDSTIVQVVADLNGADVLVVTSDRELRRRVEALGAQVRGAGWLRTALDDVGPRSGS